MDLKSSSYDIDQETGAVLIHKSPVLLKLNKMEKEIKEINNKLDKILELLEGGE